MEDTPVQRKENVAEPDKSPQGLQKINVKLFADAPRDLDYDILLAIFGRWRLDSSEEVMDLADYAHVDHGPNCLLVGHRWHFGIDLAEGRPGFFFSTRKGLSGSPADRIAQALRGLLEKTKRLCSEPDFPGAIKTRTGELEVVLNDRIVAPNTSATDGEWRPGLDQVSAKLYGPGAASVEREVDPARRLGYRVRAEAGNRLSLDEMLRRLG